MSYLFYFLLQHIITNYYRDDLHNYFITPNHHKSFNKDDYKYHTFFMSTNHHKIITEIITTHQHKLLQRDLHDFFIIDMS